VELLPSPSNQFPFRSTWHLFLSSLICQPDVHTLPSSAASAAAGQDIRDNIDSASAESARESSYSKDVSLPSGPTAKTLSSSPTGMTSPSSGPAGNGVVSSSAVASVTSGTLLGQAKSDANGATHRDVDTRERSESTPKYAGAAAAVVSSAPDLSPTSSLRERTASDISKTALHCKAAVSSSTGDVASSTKAVSSPSAAPIGVTSATSSASTHQRAAVVQKGVRLLSFRFDKEPLLMARTGGGKSKMPTPSQVCP
jgi:hypothetical protein